MPDREARAQRQRRGNWVSLRTLRQRPKPAGWTESGDAVFEVRSVRLVLRGDSSHFNRLVSCSKCSREVAGSPVLTPEDLERSTSPVICQSCVKAASMDAPWRPPVAVQSQPEPVAPPEPLGPAAPAHEERAVQARLDELSEALEHRPTEEATRALVEAAVQEALASARAEMARSSEAAVQEALTQARAEMALSAEVAAVTMAKVEDEVREAGIALAKLVDAQRAQLTALAGTVTSTRSELDRLRVAQEQLTAVPAAMDTAALDELRAEVAALGEGRQAATERDHDVQRALSRLSAMVAALRSDVEGAVARAAQEAEALAGARAELSAAQSELERRVEAMAVSIEAEERRIHGLEERVLEELRRLYAQLDRPLQPLPAPAAAVGSLVETLDAQLQAAESRLAARAVAPRVHLLIEPGTGNREE